MQLTRVAALSAAAVALCAGSGMAQLRVCTWNISNYGGGLQSDLQNVFYASFEGRSMSPDLFLGLEITSQTGVDTLVTVLNNGYQASTGSSNRPWIAAPFTNGPDTDGCVIYRSDKLTYISRTLLIAGGNVNGAPRDIYRYDLRVKGYDAQAADIVVVPVHYKSGSSSGEQARRLIEANAVRAGFTSVQNARPLANFLVGGDFNIQSSGQAAYGAMVNAGTGQVIDPIKTPGSWNNNGNFRIVHTQDPIGAGGMDDRHDQILISNTLANGTGLDYIGNVNLPYNAFGSPDIPGTPEWNDLDHSYRAWGNDGTTFDVAMRIVGNTMVGQTIAQSIVNCAAGGGHLPVFLDLRVPAKASTSIVSNALPVIYVGDSVQQTLTVTNSADVALWTTAGVSNLNYSLSISGGGVFSTTGGNFVEPIDALPADGQTHIVTLNTSTPGAFTGSITLTTDDPDRPSIVIPLAANVYCPSDINRNFEYDFGDFLDFFNAFDTAGSASDVNRNGEYDFGDFLEFFNGYDQGC